MESAEHPEQAGGINYWQQIRQWRYFDITIAVLIALVVMFLYVQIIDPKVIGFTHDDGVYMTSSKALAEGKGFTLLHVVTQPAQIKYPIGYPLILAVGWLMNPNFPDNLPLLNYITILFSALSASLAYLYLIRFHNFPRWLSVLVVAMTVGNFYFLYFFTTIMSEAPYLFFSLLTLWYAQRQISRSPILSMKTVLVLVALSAITFHMRVLGITLMAGVGVWLLLQRQWKNALIYGAGCVLLALLPWLLWTRLNTPPVTDINYPLLNAYSNYSLEFVHNYKAGRYVSTLLQAFGSFINRLLESLFPLIPNFFKVFSHTGLEQNLTAVRIYIFGLLGCAYALMGYYVIQIIHAIRKSAQAKPFDGSFYSIPALYLLFYCVIIMFWNYEEQIARFLTVVSPLLWLYFFKPLLPAAANLRLKPVKGWTSLSVILLAVVIALWTADSSYRTIRFLRQNQVLDADSTRWLWGEYQDAFGYIREKIPPKAPFAVASDVVFYLYTDHPTFYLFFASLRRENGQYQSRSLPLLMQSFEHYGVQYMIVEPHMQMRTIIAPRNLVAEALLMTFPGRFQEIYHSPREAIRIYKILPEKTIPARR